MRDPRRAVLLARVSSAEQAAGYSLDAQLGSLREYAERLGLEVVAEHAFAESAKRDTDRKRFRAILADLSRPRAPRHLVVEKSDRLTRNLGDTAAIDDLRRAGLSIHVVKQGRVLGPDSSSSDMLAWEMHAMLDRHYVRNLSEEVRKGMREKVKQGGWPHAAPLGLLNRRTDSRAWIEHDPATAPKVRDLFRRVAAERLPAAQAAAVAAELGLVTRTGRPLKANAVSALLRCPLLAGLVPVEGGWAGGRKASHRGTATSYRAAEWPAVVDAETWQAVQSAMDGRRRGAGPRTPADRESPHAYSGILRCHGCGRQVTAEAHRKGSRRYVYYRCASGSSSPCGRVYVREEKITEQIAARLDCLAIEPDALTELRAELHAASETEARERQKAQEEARRTQDRERDKVSRAVALAIDGAIRREELDAVRAAADASISRAQRQLDALAVAGRAWVDDALLVLGTLRGAGRLFRRGTAEERRTLAVLMLDAPTLRAGVLVAPLQAPWAAIEPAAATARLNHGKAAKQGRNARAKRDALHGAPCRTLPELVAAAMALRAHPDAVAAWLRAA